MSTYAHLDAALSHVCAPATAPSLRYRLSPDKHIWCTTMYTGSASAEQLMVLDHVSLGEPYRRPAERTRDIIQSIYRNHEIACATLTAITGDVADRVMTALEDLVPGHMRLSGYDTAEDYLGRPAMETLVDRTSLYRALTAIPYVVQRVYNALDIQPDVFTPERVAIQVAPTTDEHRGHYHVSWSDTAHRVDVTPGFTHDTYGGTLLGPQHKSYPLFHAGYSQDTLHILQKALERAHLELRTLVRQVPQRVTAAVTAYTDHLAELTEMGLLEKATQGLPVIADWPMASVGRHAISYYVGAVDTALEYCHMATTVLNGCSSDCS